MVGLGGKANGFVRQDGFMITGHQKYGHTLATDLKDLKERLARIIIGYNYENKPVTAGDLKAYGAMALLKDAIKPNLVQTLENTPAFIHGGPLQISHG